MHQMILWLSRLPQGAEARYPSTGFVALAHFAEVLKVGFVEQPGFRDESPCSPTFFYEDWNATVRHLRSRARFRLFWNARNLSANPAGGLETRASCS